MGYVWSASNKQSDSAYICEARFLQECKRKIAYPKMKFLEVAPELIGGKFAPG